MNDWKDEILKKWEKKGAGFLVTEGLRNRLAREFRGGVLYDEPMARHTSICIGGKADVFLSPKTTEDIVLAVKIAREENVPYIVTGCGSNMLVKDGGVRGFVINLVPGLHSLHIENENESSADVHAFAGAGITAFVNFCAGHSLAGMEALVGIPGSIGGAIVMNAGARGTEVKDLLREMTFLDGDGNVEIIPREKLEFGYRHLKLPRSSIILSGLFRLQKGFGEEITVRIREFQKMRAQTQPLDFPSLGSTFKNPQAAKRGEAAVSAGKLIEEAGLKNIRVGGARVSEKHANFIVNEKNASAKDVLVLINLIRDKVREATGVLLEPEVKIVGEDLIL